VILLIFGILAGIPIGAGMLLFGLLLPIRDKEVPYAHQSKRHRLNIWESM
jgi:hypothetical protein